MQSQKILLILAISCLLTGCSFDQITLAAGQTARAVSARADTAAQPKQNPPTTPAPKTAVQTTEPAQQTTAAPQAAAKSEEWMLRLANRTHPVGEYVPAELVTLKNDKQVDARMYPYLQQMYDAMRKKGLQPITREGYRTYAQQQDIMDSRIQQHIDEGLTEEAAKELAEAYVAVPGTSEHQLGLAVDINSKNGDNSAVYAWLKQHAHEYGFIQRYPAGKEEITGFQAEDWHYRFVGLAAAEEMYASGLTLEEYLGETQ